MTIDRRRFGVLLAGGAAVGTMPALVARGQAKARVVVIGGGPGGATAAKYIASGCGKGGGDAIDVTLVEPARQYTTCFHSNLYLGGLKAFEAITFTYDRLASAHGIRLAHQAAAAIDRERRQVRLTDGSALAYDRLVVSPGIDLTYDSVPGWGRAHEDAMPHAWKAGAQTRILKARLDAVPDGGLIVMISPPNPYRCPPAPYERVSMMAHVLKASGRRKARIIILDAKESFSKQTLFMMGWETCYPGMIEWLAPSIHDGVQSVDPSTNTVVTGFETYRAALVNVIPSQVAGGIARDAGLADASGFCPVDAASMRSTIDANVFVIGDACIAGDMPKSAFAANGQAKVAAMAVLSELGKAPMSPAVYTNTCWSLIEAGNAVKLGSRYQVRDGRITATETFISHPDDPAELRKRNERENLDWYSAFTADVFT